VALQPVRQLVQIVGEPADIDGVGRTDSGHADPCGWSADCARVVTEDPFSVTPDKFGDLPIAQSLSPSS
jgi:hypothetical protein